MVLLATSVMHNRVALFLPSIVILPGAEKKHTVPDHSLATTGVGYGPTPAPGTVL